MMIIKKHGLSALLLAATLFLFLLPAMPAAAAEATDDSLVVYSGHQQTYGDLASAADGSVLGTTGQSKRLEAVCISKGDALEDVDGSILYRVHVQSYGTQDWVSDGAPAGTTGQSKRIEAIQIRLTGELSEQYDIYYSVHVQKYGWTEWTKGLSESESADGTAGWCGTSGLALRIEAIQIQLVPKGGSEPTNSGFFSYVTASDLGGITYSGHQQSYGNLAAVSDGTVLGVTGRSKRMEAVSVSLSGSTVSGNVTYRTYVQTYGWQSWVSDGSVSGTTGQSKRMEAVEIKLTGDIANYCDVWYRVHVQSFGWLGWAKNGQTAGTTGMAYRVEAIEIQLVPKGSDAPGANSGYYKNAAIVSTATPIMNSPTTTVSQMVSYYQANASYPSYYGSSDAATITAFCQMYYDECVAEGVDPAVAFCQAMLETDFLKFDGRVPISAYNFAGLGAVDSDNSAYETYSSVQIGIRAQVQHLKAYASTDSLNQTCVDTRFSLVTRGCAIYVEWLGTHENPNGYGWATSVGYGASIRDNYMAQLYRY